MRIELACLVANALWGLFLVQVEILGKTRVAGTAWNMGNRDATPAFPPWIDRAGRALANHKENFPLFLTAVVVVELTGHGDRTSAIAAVVYVLARAAHGVLYIAGVKGSRSATFIVGLLAALVVLARGVF
jgi:uncharacterized MAPEG superfamily protein